MMLEKSNVDVGLAKAREMALQEALGEPDIIDHDNDTEHCVDVHAYGRNFIEECSDEENDEGYVLVTSGMSDHLMSVSETKDVDESLAIELIWYVRDLNAEYFQVLRWLAKFPFLDKTRLGFGHTIRMPEKLLSFCKYKTVMFLPPIIRTDRELFDGITQQGEALQTLVVHLISDEEHALIKTDNGLDEFLVLLDENEYPKILSPDRDSYV